MKLLKQTYWFILSAVLVVSTVKGQTVPLVDDGVRQCLIATNPSILDAQNDLDTVKAKGVSGTLDCNNRNVKNVSDLVYFTAVKDLKLNNNDIVDLTPIANLTQLVSIEITSNELEFVPDLTSFLSLTEFNANYNQLDDFPVFPTNIKTIRVGNNSLAGTIDVTGKSQLSVFEIFENDVREIKGLETINLTYGDFHTNELSQAKNITGLNNLRYLNLNDNEYIDIPQLSVDKLEFLDISQNALTFEDILPYAYLGVVSDSLPNFHLQVKQETTETITVHEDSSWVWALSFDASVTTSIYHWFKNGVEFTTTNVGELNLTSLQLSDSGSYYCEIENTTAGLSGGRLITNTKTLKITQKEPCFTLDEVVITVDAPSCQSFANVSIEAITTDAIGNVIYVLDGKGTTDGKYLLEQEGVFEIAVKDESCTVVANEKVEVVFDLNNLSLIHI